jgi:hypothetical protein
MRLLEGADCFGVIEPEGQDKTLVEEFLRLGAGGRNGMMMITQSLEQHYRGLSLNWSHTKDERRRCGIFPTLVHRIISSLASILVFIFKELPIAWLVMTADEWPAQLLFRFHLLPRR